MSETISMKRVDNKWLVMVKDERGIILSHLSTVDRKEVPELIKKAKQYYPNAKLTA